MSNLREDWLSELNNIDCKNFVLNAYDFLHSLSLEEVRLFNNMLYKYNKDRLEENIPITKYFVVERHLYPMFKTNDDFVTFLEKSYKDYKKKIDESNSFV